MTLRRILEFTNDNAFPLFVPSGVEELVKGSLDCHLQFIAEECPKPSVALGRWFKFWRAELVQVGSIFRAPVIRGLTSSVWRSRDMVDFSVHELVGQRTQIFSKWPDFNQA